ncbi:TetR family transcriptional regulator [Winogradskya consettensis]|uniref:TetR family transcriptional regulator n=1 Tax=Winogradskya consettensis TaxID=113560 RepID=A0A919T384_9ACTN|nr:TetR family transcriptional regulator [Actinoplanes consettensis]GIM83126.1 TetR family transcriptional regulator [Actinoplanes consettensis]
MTMNRSGGGARARARQAMQAQVAEIVMDLVLERGYEETTVEDICAAAEISRSTFFRYFPSKEAALFGASADAGERLLEALVGRPEGETAWVAMRRALDPLIEQYAAHDERVRRLTRLVVTTPVLAASHREKNGRWQELLRPEIARRLGSDPEDASDPAAGAVIAAALGCVEATLIAWTSSDHEQELGKILDRAMGAVGT